ncbi:MarC family protein [Methylocaldum sp. MU1018]
MDEGLLQFALTAFFTLAVVVDPLGAAPIFIALTRGLGRSQRRKTLGRALLIAFGVTIFFLLAGKYLLSYLGVTVHAFAISGGILLFATATPMLFGLRAGLQAPKGEEKRTAGEDIAIFPLAIPLLSGPGTITAVLLLANRAGADIVHLGVLAGVIAAIYLITWWLLYISEILTGYLGEGKVHIITRVLGIVLAALAVQFVLNGIRGFYDSLVGP